MVETIWTLGIPIVAILIVAIGAYAIWRNVKERRSGFALKDERTSKIQGKAATVAFYLGTYYLLILNFYNLYRIEFQGLNELGSMPVINSAVILMGISYIVFFVYFNRKDEFQE